MKNCTLCHENDQGTWIKRYVFWNLGVCPYQHTLGTLVVVSKMHKELFPEITTEEFLELQDIIRASYGTLKKTFHPDWCQSLREWQLGATSSLPDHSSLSGGENI